MAGSFLNRQCVRPLLATSFLGLLLFTAHSLLPPIKLVLLGSSLVFLPPGLSCTWADVSFILFADPESSESFFPDLHLWVMPQHLVCWG